MAAVNPSYFNGVSSFNPYYNTEIGRRFARTTRAVANMLLKGTIEALNTGNEMEFASAYLMYSGVQPSNVGTNDGSSRFNVLTNLLRITYNADEVAIITISELQSLGSRLQTNSSIPRADILLSTVCVQTFAAAGMNVDMTGGSPLIVTVENTDIVEAQNFVFNYTRPTGLMVSCMMQFVYGPVGQAVQPATHCVFLSSDAAESYSIGIPMGATRVLTFIATTPHLIDPASNFTKASRGYERAKACRVFNERLYSSLDECLSAQGHVFRQNESVGALLIILLEAYEDTSLALSLSAVRY